MFRQDGRAPEGRDMGPDLRRNHTAVALQLLRGGSEVAGVENDDGVEHEAERPRRRSRSLRGPGSGAPLQPRRVNAGTGSPTPTGAQSATPRRRPKIETNNVPRGGLPVSIKSRALHMTP